MEPRKEPSNTLIYVSNLPFETNDEQLRDLFKGFNLKTAYVAKKKNGKSKGFGFVNLEKESDQNAAIERVNGSEFNSRKLIAKVAMNDERRNEKGELKEEFRNQQNNQVASETVVYVSNLAWSVKDEDLKKIFSEYNPKVVTVATKRSGRSKGFGFVEFNNKEDREKALSLDQKSFHERTITVKPSTGYRGDRPRDRSRDNRRRNRSRNNRNRSRDNNRRSRDNNRNRSRNNRNRSRDNNRRSRENRNRSRDNNRSNNNNNNNNNNQQRTENKPKTENTVIGAEILTNPKQKKQNNKQTNTNNKTTNTKQNNNNQNKTNNNNQNKQKQTVNKQTQNTQTNNQSTSKPKTQNPQNKPKTQNPQNKPKTQNPQTKTEKKPKTDSFSKVVSNRRTPNKTKKNTPTTENKSTNESSSNNNKNNNSNNRSNDRQREKRSEFTLYVKNLPFELDDKDLRDVFAEFHPKSSRIATTNSGRSKGYGFVEFNNENDQNNALRALDQSEINDRLVTVKLSSPNKERRRNRRSRSRSRSNRRSSNNNRQPSTTTVHVSNLEFSIDDKDLAGIFKELQISKAYVVKTQTGRSKGFGFVEFSNSEDQQKSLKRSGEEVKGRTIRVQASYVRDN